MELQEKLFDLIASGNIDALKELIKNNPQLINAANEDGVSAVLYSFYVQKPDIANYLIEKGAKVGIFEASAGGSLEKLKEILDQSPECVNEYSSDGFQPLGYACFFGYANVARLLIKSGATINSSSQNNFKVAPLHSAAANQSLEIARMLIENGAKINAVQNGGYTALHSAAFNGQIEMVKLLIGAGANPGMRNSENKTPQDLAQEEGHQMIVEFFKQLNA